MRFALVAMIWLVLVGGLSLYTWQRDRQRTDAVATEPLRAAPLPYTLEVTTTFTTAADPFALRGDPAGSATLLVRLADRELIRSDQPVEAGLTQSLQPVQGLVVGHNELFLRAVPPQGEARDHAVRVRLLQGGRVVLDQTVWGETGAVVAGTLPFELKESGEVHHER